MNALPLYSRQMRNGGADRDQTDDLVVANDALYQLSYCPVGKGTYLEIRGRQVHTNLGAGP